MTKHLASSVCSRSGVVRGVGGLLLSVFLLSAMALAQLTTGTISGTVADASGAAVPGAAVVITNVDTGITRNTTTGPAGRYEAPNLPSGRYEVRASLQGFQTSIRTGIDLTVGRNAVVDHTLQIGEVTQQVTVTGEAALVETTTATVSQLVDAQKVEDLPLNNRDLTQLSFLQPGVIKIPTSGIQGVFSGMGEKVSVGGARQTQNAYLLDGVSNADFSGNAQGASGAYLGADTIKEYQVITNNYSAEYRSQAGAIISAVTKSGSNSLHGTAFEYLRNDNLDAANFFDNAVPGGKKPEFKRNQFGGSLGGPIIRDKTFFFGSYEGLRERLNTTNQARIPSADAHRGILPLTDSEGNVIGTETVGVSDLVRPYLDLWPVPGQGNSIVETFNDGSVRVAGTKQQPTRSDFVAGKMDHQFANQKLGMWSATYNYDDSSREFCGILCDFAEAGEAGGFGILSLKHTFSTRLTGVISPTTINDFNVGYSFNDIAGEFGVSDREFPELAFLPGRDKFGQINIGELDAFGFRVDGSFYNQKVLTFKDGVSMTKGNHSLRFGGELNHYTYGQESCSRGCFGIYDFRSMRDFLTANPRRFQGFAPGSDSPPYQFTQWLGGIYFQDNWQITPSLTLNLGLRYEIPTVPQEENDQIANYLTFDHDSLSAPASIQSRFPNFPFAGTIDTFYENPGLKSFSPRFGFAWAPGNRRTSIRGGFGIFYEHIQLFNLRTTIQELPPFSLVVRIDDSRTRNLAFPDVVTENSDGFFNQPTFNIRVFDFRPKNTYIYRYSLTLQRELGTDWVVSAGYTGSRALHLWTQGLPNITRWDGWPANPAPGTRKHFTEGQPLIKPALGEIRLQSSNANSWYNGVALSAQKRMRQGLQLQLSYNFANSIDQGSGVTSGGEELPQSQRGIYFWDMHLKKQPSAFDIRHNFVTNFGWELPFGQQLTGIGGALVKGWQLNGILSLSTGHPLTALDTNERQIDVIGDNENLRPELIPGGDNNPVLGGPEQYFDTSQFVAAPLGFFGNAGPGTVRSPGTATVDFSLFKNFQFTEENRLQFRAEFFNLFNRVNFADPDMTVIGTTGEPNQDAGAITRAAPARQIQFALRYIF